MLLIEQSELSEKGHVGSAGGCGLRVELLEFAACLGSTWMFCAMIDARTVGNLGDIVGDAKCATHDRCIDRIHSRLVLLRSVW